MATLSIETPDQILDIEFDGTPTKEMIQGKLKANGIDPSEYDADIDAALGVAPDNGDLVDDPQTANPDAAGIKLPDQITQLQSYAQQFPFGSKEQAQAYKIFEAERDNYLKLNPQPKNAGGEQLPATVALKISNFLDKQNKLRDLMKLKSSGFGGAGVDTGPIVGGKIPIPFTDADPNIVPSGVSQAVGEAQGLGESAADRARLRALNLQFLNPERKDVTGAGASVAELADFIFPSVPTETDNDLGFYQKGLDSAKQSQEKLGTTLKALKEAGFDTSKFTGDTTMSPEDYVNNLIDMLSGDTGEYGFGSVMPNTVKGRKTGNPGGGINIDQNKLQEELKKRGLK